MTPVPRRSTGPRSTSGEASAAPADAARAGSPAAGPPVGDPAAAGDFAAAAQVAAGARRGDQGSGSPTVRRRVLAAELKSMRRSAGLTHVDIANRLGWQQGKVSKIESAKQGVGIEAVIALSDVCQASPAHRDRLVELARAARAKGWWESYGDVLAPEQRTYVGLEADADVVSVFGVESVPELLRTREYAEGLLRADPRVAEREGQVERAIEVLVARQRNLFERVEFQLDVVLSESALLRVAGGAVGSAREQYARLVALTERPDVVLRVLPFSAGALPVDSAFSILEFRNDPHPEVVFVPGRVASTYVEHPVVSAYREAMTVLRSLALDPAGSTVFIQDVERRLVSASAT